MSTSKKVAFSVWPIVNDSVVPEEIKSLWEISANLLRSDGWEVRSYHDFTAFDDIAQKLIDDFGGIFDEKQFRVRKKFMSYSDYYRLHVIQKLFDEGFEEVLYFDFDFIWKSAPKTYGIGLEIHIQTEDEHENYNSVEKFWFRGVNCVYHLNRDHIGVFNQHVELIKNHLTRFPLGKIKYCYPMNHLWILEESIGYCDGAFHFGGFDEPSFCSKKKIKQILTFCKEYFKRDIEVIGVNCMSSRRKSVKDTYEEIMNTIEDANTNPSKLDSNFYTMLYNTKKPLRVNYGASKTRESMKRFIENKAKDTLQVDMF